MAVAIISEISIFWDYPPVLLGVKIMYWLSVDKDSRRIALINQLLTETSKRFWSDAAMESASHIALGDKNAWTEYFVGYQDAIWHLANLADLEMERGVDELPRVTAAQLVKLRIVQNSALKAAVRHLFVTDIRHPILAVKRTDRSSKRILATAQLPITPMRIKWTTIKYTAVVIAWLMEPKTSTKCSLCLADLLF